MKKINIKQLNESLHNIEWNYDFKIVKHKDGSADLNIPGFILRDIEWAIEDGRPTPREQVSCLSENEE